MRKIITIILWATLFTCGLATIPAQTPTPADPRRAEADKVYEEGRTLFNQGTPEARRASSEKFAQARKLYQALNLPVREAEATIRLGFVESDFGNMQGAVDYYQQALPLFVAGNDKPNQAGTLTNMGLQYFNLGRQQEALECYEKALPLFRELDNKIGEANVLTRLGRLRHEIGAMPEALQAYHQALVIYEAEARKDNQAAVLNGLGSLHRSLSQNQEALTYFDKALILSREAEDRRLEAAILNNMGALYDELGNYQKALEYYFLALKMREELKDQRGAAIALSNIGSTYYALGNQQQAMDYLKQGLALHLSLNDKPNVAVAYGKIGAIHRVLGDFPQALAQYNLALALWREIGNPRREGDILVKIGKIYNDNGGLRQPNTALDYFGQALRLYHAASNKLGQAEALSQSMISWHKLRQPRLAVFWGKQGFNIYQALRANSQKVDKETQQAYLKTMVPFYQDLAKRLIEQGRLAEAQQVLNAYKDQQFFDVDNANRKTPARLALTPREARNAALYEQASAKVGELSRQLAAAKRSIGRRQPTAEETAQVKQWEADTQQASDAFRAVLQTIAEDFKQPLSDADKAPPTADLREMQTALRDLRQQNGKTTVAVYTLLGKDTFRALLITPDTIADVSHPTKSVAVNEDARRLWSLLQTSQYDPRPVAQRLYQVIFAPLAAKLPQDTETILWSLDGNLRYVPMAALHDGQQYLAERYNHVVFTRADGARLTRQPNAHWTGLGLGSSAAHRVKTVTEELGFDALPGVTAELSTLFQRKGQKGGLLAGEVLADEQFTKTAMLTALQQKRPLVHIASHFRFSPGNDISSFLLLGDGSTYTLNEMKQARDLFGGVELLTLSACETAAQRPDANGREIDGFAELAQRQGASAVMATLWKVADSSTPWLMQSFYARREGGLGKAAALRQAQIALLKGTARIKPLASASRASAAAPLFVIAEPAPLVANPLDDETPTRSERLAISPADALRYRPDPKKPFAHPYYWAAFVIFGNSR